MRDTNSVGGWIPLTKSLASELPRDRAYTRLEAMFSLTLDYDQGKQVSVCGYARLWGWSEGRVRRFLKEVGAYIDYPEKTSNRQNQRGVIVIVTTGGSQSHSGGIRAIDSKWLSNGTNGKRSDTRGMLKASCSSTTEPKPNPKPKPTAAARTKTEAAFLVVFAEKESRIRELFPYAQFEAEKETCIAHYAADAGAAMDPYQIILKWFNRIPRGGLNAKLHSVPNRSTQPSGFDDALSQQFLAVK